VWKGARVAVIVPAYREEALIATMLAAVPSFVDQVIVVDDASPDGTSRAVESVESGRIVLLRHPENRGVGAALATGYLRALEDRADVIVVMAGDNQMDPADLPRLLDAVVHDGADYAKGNRFVHAEVANMPLPRRIAGKGLAWLTRCAGRLYIDDSQCGYTALAARAAREVPWHDLWPRYGYPNDLLILLGRRGFQVSEVPVRPVYAGEQSGVRPWHALTVTGVIARRWWSERRRQRAESRAAGRAPVGS
jgi:glycosyltransferase involved in cell wall biosynthesis